MSDYTPPPTSEQTNALDRVNLPGVFLVVAGCLNLVAALVLLLSGVNTARMSDEELKAHVDLRWKALPPRWIQLLESQGLNQKRFEESARQTAPQIIGWGAAAGLMALLAIVGGLRMRQLRSHGLAVTGSILMAVPCISPLGCCLVGEVVGIWCLVVLFSGDVSNAFAQASSTPSSQGPP